MSDTPKNESVTPLLDSILPHEFDNGVVVITGYRGIGKSYLAAQFEVPWLTTYADMEGKAKGLDSMLHFKRYISMMDEAQNTDIKSLWAKCDEVINTPANGSTVIVFDNGSLLELALTYEAKRNSSKYINEFALNASNVESGRFGGIKSVVNYLIQSKVVAPLFKQGYRTIVVTFHIKPRWATTGPIPGKYNIKGADRWQELSILTLILHPGESSLPAALVQKEQLGSIKFNKETRKFEIKRRLPLRLPIATSEAIYDYLNNPADIANPKNGEYPTIEQIDPFRDELTREQLMYMVEMSKASQRIDEDEKEEMRLVNQQIESDKQSQRSTALSMKSGGMSIPQIAQSMNISVPEVARLLQ